MRFAHSLLMCLACTSAGPSFADPLDGEFVLEFGYENAVWGPGEEEVVDECQPEGCLSGNMSVDPRGVISGGIQFVADFDSDGIHVTGGMSGGFKGKVKGKNAVARMKLKGKMSGVLQAAGYPDLPVKGSLSVVEVLDGVQQTDTSSGSFKICAKGAGCDKQVLPAETVPLVPEDGGPWTLALDVTTDSGGAISGTALASFSDGSDPISFDVSGRYQAKKDESSLKLASAAPGPGASAKLAHVHATQGNLDALRIKYKICGQSGQRVVP